MSENVIYTYCTGKCYLWTILWKRVIFDIVLYQLTHPFKARGQLFLSSFISEEVTLFCVFLLIYNLIHIPSYSHFQKHFNNYYGTEYLFRVSIWWYSQTAAFSSEGESEVSRGNSHLEGVYYILAVVKVIFNQFQTTRFSFKLF